ncbi:type I-E CRISPR-associated protein Cse2/CasB [Methylicorpusculum sp.]|uniref:type I-E CRISPR-associated protein Cse2/CasB n=1 Tax=Methylicorpusculum sp. TaxID=2713644 RepID=UPI002730F0DB|nr:type I-E CRISPR-associated protein Cse2/CasB [Methylicorpusculum sp.]MDP2176923.1 type I-E CRISPR-associated protein Cse2/CasB [Methylicorpusculum sp.]MDP3528693.1 type I-E CRISPR-associated protein Cse2/CasB [Methylicorpusculum sp.]MDZ4150923.1 type I-E CRISPR-associated protein Cse2/CasB [Methylicorpusculum sp.]
MNQYPYLVHDDQKALEHWHQWLDDNRGDRARLRRAEGPEDILLTDAFFHFLEKMPDTGLWRDEILISASVAGALSHVKTHKLNASQIYKTKNIDNTAKNASFAEQLATPSEGKGKAPMSELRFQQLQKSKTIDDFYRRILRAIRLLDGNVNILSLANDIIHWHREFEHAFDRNPNKRLVVRWATDYFTALANLKS